MIIRTNGYCFFNRTSIGSENKLKKFFGVKSNSYAGKTIARLYNYFFGNAFKIKKHYKKYYRKEFSSCKDFLVCKYNLSEPLAWEIIKNDLYCTNMGLKIDEIIYSFNHDTELMNLFKEYVGGIRYEN